METTTIPGEDIDLKRQDLEREQEEARQANDDEAIPGGWQVGDDLHLAPQGAFLGTTQLSGQISLLPETCAVKFAGTVGVEGGQLRMGERIRFTAEAIVSGDNTSGKVKAGGLEEPKKVQTATVISAERVE